jgi:hypothetical protein
MKKFLFIAVFFLGAFFTSMAQTNSNHVYVNGYYKSNGTYVNGYYRTAPNNTINDNFSTYPNVNPYTGKTGTIAPSYNSTPSLPKTYYNNYNKTTTTTTTYPLYNNSYYQHYFK